jgi:hypothetical protein
MTLNRNHATLAAVLASLVFGVLLAIAGAAVHNLHHQEKASTSNAAH